MKVSANQQVFSSTPMPFSKKRVAENMAVNQSGVKQINLSRQMPNRTTKRRKRTGTSVPRRVQFNIPEEESPSNKSSIPKTSSLLEAVTTTQLKMKFLQRRLERLQLEALLEARQANLKKRLPAVQQNHPSLISHLQAGRAFSHEAQATQNAAVVDMLMRHKVRHELFRRYTCEKLDLILPRAPSA